MGLRREVQEELEEKEFRESQNAIVEKYYTDPDAGMRSIGGSFLHDKFVGEYEPSPEEKRMMELELEINRLKHGH